MDLKKCEDDIIYFLDKYAFILNFDGKEKLKLREYQKELLNHISNNNYCLINKTRQCGASTIPLFYFLHLFLFLKQDIRIDFHAFKFFIAKDLVKKFKLLYNFLPEEIKKIKNIEDIDFLEKNGWISICSKNSINPIKILFCDEISSFHKEIFNNIEREIHNKTYDKVIISGKSGNSNFDELNNIGVFSNFIINWDDVDSRDENWKKEVISQIGLEHFKKEYIVNV